MAISLTLVIRNNDIIPAVTIAITSFKQRTSCCCATIYIGKSGDRLCACLECVRKWEKALLHEDQVVEIVDKNRGHHYQWILFYMLVDPLGAVLVQLGQ